MKKWRLQTLTEEAVKGPKKRSKEIIEKTLAPTNETKLAHTYLPTYIPNKTVPNETGGEREDSL